MKRRRFRALVPGAVLAAGCALVLGCKSSGTLASGAQAPAPASDGVGSAADRPSRADAAKEPQESSRPSGALGEDRAVVFLHVFPVEQVAVVPEGEFRLLARPGVGGLPNELVRRGWGSWSAGDVLSVRPEPHGADPEDPVLPAHTSCSFLIDCDEPPVQKLASSLGAAGSPAPAELAAFVSHHIEKKSYGRAFDVASVVAVRREGDCTEHATLLAALARSRGLPARIVLGLALVHLPGEAPQAFGHAWTEIHEQGRWQVHDAALHAALTTQTASNPGPVRVDYLPLQLITDEGPGFGKQMLSGAGPLQMRGVQVGSK